MKYFTKIAKEYAPGIPKKGKISVIPSTTNQLWEFSVQEHDAKRAGLHYDLRLGDNNANKAYSWAIPKWPKPGEKRLAIRTNDHTIPYMDFIGTLPKGYGQGTVKRKYRGPALIKDSSEKKINFTHDKIPYTLIKTKDEKSWIILNRSK